MTTAYFHTAVKMAEWYNSADKGERLLAESYRGVGSIPVWAIHFGVRKKKNRTNRLKSQYMHINKNICDREEEEQQEHMMLQSGYSCV